MLPKIFRDLAAFQGLLWILAAGAFAGEATKSRPPENLFANASFEDGRDLWQMDRAGKTTATFLVDDKDAAAGRRSAVLHIESADNWGVQFGQTMEAPAAGKTYTFAVLAKSVSKPVTIRLEIERHGQPYDRAAASPPLVIGPGAWTESHVTFQVDKPFPEGWFAYVSCRQAVRGLSLGHVPPLRRRLCELSESGPAGGGGRGGPLDGYGRTVAGSACRRGNRPQDRLEQCAGRRYHP